MFGVKNNTEAEIKTEEKMYRKKIERLERRGHLRSKYVKDWSKLA